MAMLLQRPVSASWAIDFKSDLTNELDYEGTESNASHTNVQDSTMMEDSYVDHQQNHYDPSTASIEFASESCNEALSTEAALVTHPLSPTSFEWNQHEFPEYLFPCSPSPLRLDWDQWLTSECSFSRCPSPVTDIVENHPSSPHARKKQYLVRHIEVCECNLHSMDCLRHAHFACHCYGLSLDWLSHQPAPLKKTNEVTEFMSAFKDVSATDTWAAEAILPVMRMILRRLTSPGKSKNSSTILELGRLLIEIWLIRPFTKKKIDEADGSG
jgi:hypothetical protein